MKSLPRAVLFGALWFAAIGLVVLRHHHEQEQFVMTEPLDTTAPAPIVEKPTVRDAGDQWMSTRRNQLGPFEKPKRQFSPHAPIIRGVPARD